MSSIVDAQLQTIKSSFLKILEIGKSNCDSSTIMVLSILGQMDSTLVNATLKERVVEIIETESCETMESSMNDALRKHLLPPISEEVSPRALEQQKAATAKQQQLSSFSAAIPASQMAQPAKVELKESKAEAIAFPPKICALAKEAGVTLEQLQDRLQLVTIDGRLCGVFKDYHGDPALIKFLNLLETAAQKKEIALFREGAFATDKYPGYIFGLDEENLYLFVGFMKFCMENALGTYEQMKDNQIRMLSYFRNADSMEKVLLPDILQLFKNDFANGVNEAGVMLIKTGVFLSQYIQYNEMKPSQIRDKIELFEDATWWDPFCSTLLFASFARIGGRLSEKAQSAILKGAEKTWDDPAVQEGCGEISVDMRDDEFVKATIRAMPKIPKDVFTLLHMGSNHFPGFISKLSAKCKVALV